MTNDEKSLQMIEMVRKNRLELDDTFEFACKQCGNCCRNRDNNPILLQGYDIYNIAKALGMTPATVMEKYTTLTRGYQSKLPVLYIKARVDGSCPFLRTGKCTIQKDKPVVCRVYPLGRGYDGNEFFYFKQEQSCEGEKIKTTLREWKEEFDLFHMDALCSEYSKTLFAATKYILKLQGQKEKEFFSACLQMLYLAYDMTLSFEENFKRNQETLCKLFKGFKI